MSSNASNADATVATRVSETLKATFAAVAEAALSPAEKGRWHQRLIAITNTTKHDVHRADAQLQRFLQEWNAVDGGKEIVQ